MLVTDQGTGIPGLTECHDGGCYQYFEFGKSVKERGTGIGMLFVIGTALDEGWGLSIRSAVDGGTTVRLSIPAAGAPSRGQPSSPAPRAALDRWTTRQGGQKHG